MRILVLGMALLSLSMAQAQNPQKFWIGFNHKNNTPFSLNEPLQFLSQRALDRRAAQSISLDTKDLPVDPNYVAQVAATGATILHSSRWFNGVSIELQDSSDIDLVTALPFVTGTAPVNRLSAKPKTTERKFGELSFEKANSATQSVDYGTGYNQIDMLNGVPLHEQGFMGQGMLIAVLDAGFSNALALNVFDSLHNDGRVIATKDFVEGDLDVYSHHPHGTQVLSTMASYWEGEFVGTAPLASYILLRSEEGGSETIVEEDNWVAAAEFADSAGADIINSSLGYTTFDHPSMDHSYADMDGNTTRITKGADIAASRGILVVNSAGNSGQGSWYYIGAPADGDSVFAIGAVNAEGIYAEFSSKGPTFDGRVKPNVVAQGAGAIIADLDLNAIEPTHPGNGTSFSGPIIAGMMACFWQAFPELTNVECMDIVQQSASLYSNPNEFMGYGIPDFSLAYLITKDLEPEGTEADEMVTVFPSPFQDELSVAFYPSRNRSLTVKLIDAQGKLVRCESMRSMPELKLTGLTGLVPGVYTVAVEGDENFATKVVKLE